MNEDIRILIVDDEETIAQVHGLTLERLGYAVTMHTDSIDALNQFRARPDDFDLVITDMTMPHMTGDKLAAEVKRIRPDTPVILCTGYSKKVSDMALSDLGVTAVVHKPVVKADLARAARSILDARITNPTKAAAFEAKEN